MSAPGALSRASRNPLIVVGFAIVLGLLVAGVHFWSESFVAGWTSSGLSPSRART